MLSTLGIQTAPSHAASPHDDNLSLVLGPFSTDSQATQLASLVEDLRQKDFTLPDISHQFQPTCCELYAIDEKLGALDTGTKDSLCEYIGHDIDDNRLEHYNLNNPENGSLYKLRPKPRQYFCDRYLLDKARSNILFFNHYAPPEITPSDHNAIGVWKKSVVRSRNRE